VTLATRVRRLVDHAPRTLSAAEQAQAADPVALARAAGLEPDSWQVAVLRSTSSRQLLNCCRQSGKSTTTALLAVWTALYTPGALCLLVSPSLRQSSELFLKAVDLYRQLGRPVPADSENRLSLELGNGARIVSLPGSERTLRGFSAVRLLAIDEAARVPDSLYLSLLPMLATSRGALLAMSTPYGRVGWFHDCWEQGGDAWERTKIVGRDCPRIAPETLAEYQATMPARWFAQEFEGEFSDVDEQVFAYDDVQAALDPSIRPLFMEDSIA
jgi:hypothetical protein